MGFFGVAAGVYLYFSTNYMHLRETHPLKYRYTHDIYTLTNVCVSMQMSMYMCVCSVLSDYVCVCVCAVGV